MPCIGESHLRSVSPVPTLLPIGVSSVFPLSFFQGEITLISKERMKYVGHNKFKKFKKLYTVLLAHKGI